MEILEFLTEALRQDGFDGLVSPGGCSCGLEDLIGCRLGFVPSEDGHIDQGTCRPARQFVPSSSDLRAFTQAKLNAAGYDGLYFPGECACRLSDMMACASDVTGCKCGHFIKNDPDDEYVIGVRAE